MIEQSSQKLDHIATLVSQTDKSTAIYLHPLPGLAGPKPDFFYRIRSSFSDRKLGLHNATIMLVMLSNWPLFRCKFDSAIMSK